MLPIALLPLLATPLAEVTVKTEDYRGWKGATRVSNGVVDLVVVPQIGRIMRFGYVGQKNLLWENPKVDGGTVAEPGTYLNYGGDKLWPAPQANWNWPPEPKIDGAVHRLEVIPNGVRLTSPLGGKIKVQFTREITLDPLAPQANLRNRMQNLGPRRELALWQVTQIISPDLVTIPFEPAPGLPKGWHGYGNERLKPDLHRIESGRLLVRRDPNASRKFGAFGRSGELIASFGSTELRTKSPVLRGARYPDSNSPLQVYTNPDPDAYVELEHNSPLLRMDRDEVVFLPVTWRLK